MAAYQIGEGCGDQIGKPAAPLNDSTVAPCNPLDEAT